MISPFVYIKVLTAKEMPFPQYNFPVMLLRFDLMMADINGRNMFKKNEA